MTRELPETKYCTPKPNTTILHWHGARAPWTQPPPAILWHSPTMPVTSRSHQNHQKLPPCSKTKIHLLLYNLETQQATAQNLKSPSLSKFQPLEYHRLCLQLLLCSHNHPLEFPRTRSLLGLETIKFPNIGKTRSRR